ncbi:hypothetical protein J4Q44_G00234720 [Coregonus suidteri]|uniref:Uncharacterized protein n=1 Tax=Coregonus suidteri TaxID=861788 RepID=A0AAN8QYP5_9TELE
MPTCLRRAGGGAAGFHQRPGPRKMREHLPPTLPKEAVGDWPQQAESGTLHGERDMLLRKLVEAEIDGVAVATQLTALNEAMGGVKKVSCTLRDLLRECHEQESRGKAYWGDWQTQKQKICILLQNSTTKRRKPPSLQCIWILKRTM